MNGVVSMLARPLVTRALRPTESPPWAPTNSPPRATVVYAPDGTPMLVEPPAESAATTTRDLRRGERAWADPVPRAQAHARTAERVREEAGGLGLAVGIIVGLAVLGPRVFR